MTTVSPPPPRLISLGEVAGRRVWCPASGGRVETPGGAFAPENCCIGPRCAVWAWRGAGDALDSERRRCHLLPPHFSPGHRVRLASRTLPDLLEPLRTLALGEGDPEGAREAILTHARTLWQPERELPEPESWRRLAEPVWDAEADTAVVDLVRIRADDERAGTCCLGRGAAAGACGPEPAASGQS